MPTIKSQPFKYGRFSHKAKQSIKNADAFINIWHGAVRSSKTINANIAFIKHLETSTHDEHLLTGKTHHTIKRNVINDLARMIHPRPLHYNQTEGEMHLLDKTVYVVGLKDESATDKLRGMTVGGWYGDEITTCPQSA